MKKTILIFILFSSFSLFYGQSFKGNISATYGILNSKIRVQYEHPVGDRFSTGANLNYYTQNFKGALLEPFFRVYARSKGNSEGWFLQAKLGYGLLETEIVDPQTDKTSKFSTFGGGIAVGNKFFITEKITVEPLIGLRIYSPPPSVESDMNNQYIDPNAYIDAASGLSWFASTGMPLDFQLKIGYQF